MTSMNGKCGSRGYASGFAVVKDSLEPEVERVPISDPHNEISKFREAQEICGKRLTGLIESSKNTNWNEAADIFKAYRSIIRDEHFYQTVFKRVRKELVNIEYILKDEVDKAVSAFGAIESDYMRERATDIKNACNELIHIMLGINNDFTSKMTGAHDIILVANDLTPAETFNLNKNMLRGIVTEHGGVASHTVILAKSMGIPAVVGVQGAVKATRDGDVVLIDGFLGKVIVNPDEQTARSFANAQRKHSESRKAYEKSEMRPAVTKDGFALNVTINSGDPAGIKAIDSNRCDGVGLLRTEFMYMNSPGYPDENTQFEIYKDIAERANGKAVVIRTLDVGGDKQATYMNLPREENPSLGYRAIRFSLDKKDIFAVQLRAALRASAFGNIKIMFPMICCVEELLNAKACLETEKQKLRDENIPFRENIPTGIMIETPAAVLLSDKLARHADFFSVGTNDLTQFTLAADRSNERLAGIYDCCNISVLRLIKIVSENAEKTGIPWGICGEAASEEALVPLWVAMGVKELSVAPSSVGAVKHLIRNLNRGNTRKDLNVVLDLEKVSEVKDYLAEH